MLTVLVANTKGGCGKTTIATHLAAAFAFGGQATVLADVDRQRSSLAWAARRPDDVSPIETIDWVRDFDRPSGPTDRLVIDAPAALKPKQAEALIGLADVIVLPVLPSVFDEAATERFIDRIETLKRLRKGRTTLALVGNRVRSRNRATRHLDLFLGALGRPTIARLRDSALYPDVAQRGLSLFDLADKRSHELRQEWSPLLRFVDGVD